MPTPGNEMSVTAWRNKARPHPDQEDHAFIPDANLIYAGIASKLNGERDGLQRPQIRRGERFKCGCSADKSQPEID
jgi:hypothetical protein